MQNGFIIKLKSLWSKPSKPVKIALGAAMVILLAGVLVRTFAGAPAPTTTTTTTPTTGATIMRTDHVLDTWGMNIKITYASGTHGQTDANYNKLKQLTNEMGLRVYRQELQTANTVGKTRQRDWMRTMNTNHGTRFHVTIGQMRNKDGFNKDWSAAQVRAYAKRDVSDTLNELDTYWKSVAPGNNLSRIIHSLAGPNEIEERNPSDNTGPNWARNARIWQQEIYEQAREGRDNATYRTVFANIPICVPSTRTDLRIETAREAAFAQPGDGSESMPQNADCGNAHLYQKGVGPTEADTNAMKTAQSPMVGGTNKPYIFSETGYNTMTYNVEGRYVGPQTVIPYGSGRGFKRNPPWVSAVYLPRAIAQYAKMNTTYVKHEFLDDVDNNQWDQEHFFGMIATPSVDPTTWVKKPDFYTMQRFYNLLKDRGTNPTVIPNHATQDLPFTVETNASQLRYLKTQKSDGSWWLLVWRDVNVWDINIINNSAGRELAVAPVDFRIRLNQGRTIESWQPNKSSSRGIGSTASWSTIPAAEQSWTVPQGGGTFTVSLKGDLKVLKIR